MKSFYHYLAESTKTYKYRIKAAVPIDATFIDTVKKALFKYDVKNVSAPKKLMMQQTPLDFRDLHMAEISIIDIETGVPASSYVLAIQLRDALQLPDKLLVVRGENEPMEIEAEKIEEIHLDDIMAAEEHDKSVLQNANYEEADQPKEVAYGDAYNKKLLNYLAQIEADGKAEEVPQIEKIKKENTFNWSVKKDTQVADDFNAEFDTVKPVHSNTKKPGTKAVEPNLTAVHGNYDENVKRKG